MTNDWNTIGRNLIIPAILSLFTLGITHGIDNALQNPDLKVVILDEKDNQTKTSTFNLLIQNDGNAPAKDILILFGTHYRYNFTSFNSTESIPKEINNSDQKLSISIDKISPQSFVILTAKGKFVENEKVVIWVFDEKSSKILNLNSGIESFGTSSSPGTSELATSLLEETGLGILFLVTFRVVTFKKSESLRRQYLGVYPIELVKFDANRVLVGCLIIGIGLLIIIVIQSFIMTDILHDLKELPQFPLEKNISVNDFIKFKNSDVLAELFSNITASNFAHFFVILAAIGYTNYGIRFPRFFWLLKPNNTSNLLLSKIESSYSKAKVVNLNDNVGNDWKKTE